TTGSGLLVMEAGLTAFRSALTNNSPAISGHIALDAPNVEFNVTNDFLNCHASIAGPDGITKSGAGSMVLYNSNGYSGLTVVAAGFLDVNNPYALGLTNNGTVVNSGATLAIFGFVFGVANESLILNGGATLFASATTTNFWVGPIALNAFVIMQVEGSFRIVGPISGPGGLTLLGGGTTYFQGNVSNSYAGLTIVRRGSASILNKNQFDGAVPGDLVIGNNSETNTSIVRLLTSNQISDTAKISIQSSGFLDLNDHGEVSGPITLDSGQISTGS